MVRKGHKLPHITKILLNPLLQPLEVPGPNNGNILKKTAQKV